MRKYLWRSGQLLTLRHDSINRECFMSGAPGDQKVIHLSGLVVGLENLLDV